MKNGKTASIGIKTQLNGFVQDIQRLRNNLTEGNIKFVDSRMSLTLTIVTVKESDFTPASQIITDSGFEILN